MTPYREKLTPAGRAVLLAARGAHGPEEVSELERIMNQVGATRVRQAATANKCEALVGEALRRLLPGATPKGWSDAVDANRLRVESLTRTLGEVLEDFERRNIAAAVIEGANSVFGAGLPISAYGAGDFDVLVDKRSWGEAKQVMKELGFAPANRRDRQTVRIEFRRESKLGTEWIEVGCQPFDRKWIPLMYQDRSAEWLSRRELVEHPIAGQVPVLCASDAMAVAAFHSSLHSYVRSPALRLQVDIDRAARHPQLRWSAFLDEIDAIGAPTRAYVSLRIASALLSTPIPEAATEALAPEGSRWPQLASLLGGEGVLDSGGRKLVGWKALRLDQLLDEHGTVTWLRNIALPPAEWMRSHFGGGPTWKAHARRVIQAGTRWRREVE